MKEPAKKADIWIEEYVTAKNQEDKEKVLGKFKTYLALHPEDLSARLKYIDLLVRENNLEEALKQIEECISYNAHPACFVLKADILNTMGRFAEVIEFIRQIKGKLQEKYRVTIEITELLALINEGRYEEALSIYNRLGKDGLLNYAARKPEEQQAVLDIILELEAYKKGLEWVKDNKNVVAKAEEIFGKYFRIKKIIPKIEGDWEVPDSPYLYVKVAEELNTEKQMIDFIERENKALVEFFESIPSNQKVTIIVEPASKKEEIDVVSTR